MAVLIVRVFLIGALIVVLMLIGIAGDEHQPHVELAPPAQSLSARPMAVAS